MDLEKIRNTKWYRQGAIAIPWFIHEGYYGAGPQVDEEEIVTYKDKENVGYFHKKQELEKAKKIIEKEKKEDYVDSVKKDWRKRAEKVLEYISTDFSNKDNEELTEYVQEFTKKLRYAWNIGALVELFDPWGEELVEKEFEKFNINLNEEELVAITSASKPNILQKEKIDRHDLIKENKLEKLKEHRDKYFHMMNSWGHAEELNEEHFRSLLNEPELEKEVKSMQENFEKMKTVKKELKKKLPEELYRILDMFSRLSEWREERKEWVMKIHHYSYRLLKEIGKRSNIEMEILEFATPGEIREIPIPEKQVKEFKKRKRVAVFTKKDDNWFYEKEAEEIIQALEESFESSEIRGNIACKGIAKGKARIIKTFEDFEKMEKGDILITIMLRPEHHPIIKKAAGIVTDEGGITCHAAIVSREMGIPCIIGTQMATKVLKDGEIIELDANKGIVKRSSSQESE